MSSADFFQNELYQKIISRTLSECQMVWIQTRTDFLSVLIWVQTVCKGYQQTTIVASSKERVIEGFGHSGSKQNSTVSDLICPKSANHKCSRRHFFLYLSCQIFKKIRLGVFVNHEIQSHFVCLFDLILYVHSTIFQLCGTGLPGLNQY